MKLLMLTILLTTIALCLSRPLPDINQVVEALNIAIYNNTIVMDEAITLFVSFLNSTIDHDQALTMISTYYRLK